MKLILSIFLAVVTFVLVWVASYLAVDAHHAWKITTTTGAFLFAFATFGLFMSYLCDGDDY